MPLVPEKMKYAQNLKMPKISNRRIEDNTIPDHAFTKMSVGDIAKLLPEKSYTPRVMKVSDDEEVPMPKRKPQMEEIPYPKRKPSEFVAKKLTVPREMSGEGLGELLDAAGARMMNKGGVAERKEMYHGGGLFNSDGAGRSDILNRDVPAGSYVIPADVVSALGDGNTLAGSKILDAMMGPQDMEGEAVKPMEGMPVPNYQEPYKRGGAIPVVTAGGEYLVSPKAITKKFGSLDRGHNALDKFTKLVRSNNVKKLKSLPVPRR